MPHSQSRHALVALQPKFETPDLDDRAPLVRLIAMIGLVAVLTLGCAAASPPIQLEGSAGDLEPLTGSWSGEYMADGPRARGGTISFTLIAGEDHAHGDVRMIPEGSSRPYERYDGREPFGPRRAFQQSAQFLTIHLVRVMDGSAYGVLDPYWDPDRDCQAWTTFRGKVTRRAIEGTFTSTYARPAAETTGRWKVTRDR